MGAESQAERYERLHPGAVRDTGQKAERMERLDFKEEAKSLRRTHRNRGIVVPPLPWKDES